MSDRQTEFSTLANGVRVISETMPGLETACLGVWVDAGTRFETAEVNGVAHMLEHMAFKGTRSRSAREIAEAIENVGGSINAYTSRENTAYYARVMAGDVPLAGEIIADILQESVFDEGELEKERHVVLQEIGQVRDTPDDLVFDLFQEAAYPDQPMGWSILGPQEVIAAMPRAAIESYMAVHYGPDRLVVGAAGKIDHAALVELAEARFGGLRPRPRPQAVPAAYAGGMKSEFDDQYEQVHLCIGVEGVGLHDPDFFACQILGGALGGGMSSRLFQEVRESRGLCYSIFSFTSSYHDSGVFGIYAGTGADEVDAVFEVIRDETLGLVDKPGTGEIDRARAQVKAGLLMALESASAVADDISRQIMIWGRRMSIAEIIEKVDAVDGAAIRRVGERLFSKARPTLAAVGPSCSLPQVSF